MINSSSNQGFQARYIPFIRGGTVALSLIKNPPRLYFTAFWPPSSLYIHGKEERIVFMVVSGVAELPKSRNLRGLKGGGWGRRR